MSQGSRRRWELPPVPSPAPWAWTKLGNEARKVELSLEELSVPGGAGITGIPGRIVPAAALVFHGTSCSEQEYLGFAKNKRESSIGIN